ncbi:MAG TPA: transglutaminase domain-containing protein, partial [Planctomycetota bacterium]|nr:transglutaminase domain-containing protein [Planctomycetota bacterium]
LETWIAARCSYSLDLAAPGGRPPVEAFLFGSRRGHCELFASAAAVMLRSVGIPARIAIGFRGGEFDAATGVHVLRGQDAHAWVEAWIPGDGWVTFDPTPAARRPRRGGTPMDELEDAGDDGRSWLGSLLSFDGESQRRFVSGSLSLAGGAVRNVFFDAAGRFRVASTAALIFGAALLAFALARRAARAAAGGATSRRAHLASPPAPEAWAAFLAFLAARGIRRAPSETPLELAVRAAAAGVGPDGAPARLADAYARERWGGRAPDPAERRTLAALARSLVPASR